MPLLVQNNASNVTIFSKGDTTIIWSPEGDPMGGDLQRCPDSYADDIDFLKSLDVGLLKVISADKPEMMERLERQSQQYQERTQAAEARQEAVMDRKADRDIIAVTCIGPNTNGRGLELCGAAVLVKAAAKGEVPPLCPRHQSLAPRFYSVPTGSKGEGATENSPGKVSTTWKQAEMTAPTRG